MGIKTVFVPVLENKTAEPGIEDFITQALTQAVVQGARVRIARSAQEADAVLEGSIVEYRLISLSFDNSANVTSYRLIIGLALTFKDVKQNKVLWKQDRIEERAERHRKLLVGAGHDPITRACVIRGQGRRRGRRPLPPRPSRRACAPVRGPRPAGRARRRRGPARARRGPPSAARGGR